MNRDLFFQDYLVVFLDILGQRESLRRITGIPITENEEPEFIDLVRKSIGKVFMIRDAFQNFFDAANSHNPNADLVPPEHREEFLAAQRAEVHFYGLSDSLIIAVPLTSNDENCAAMNGVYSALIATSGIGLIALSKRVAIRAGLDVGIATQIDDREIYGPALERAYHLESQLAEYPRFLIGNELVNYLVWVEGQQPQTRLGLVAKNTAERCRKMIIRDTDGRLMLDFLGTKVGEASGNSISKEVVIAAHDFVVTQYKKYLSEENDKLASRYYRLMCYFESRQTI